MPSSRKLKSYTRRHRYGVIEHYAILDDNGVWRWWHDVDFPLTHWQRSRKRDKSRSVWALVKSRLWYDGRRAAAVMLGLSEQNLSNSQCVVMEVLRDHPLVSSAEKKFRTKRLG